ncbi:tetratricopeptide repeat protein [Edaphobacter albus]|uniref:tetratricopeptide repeat protein n=1 Tax=Edaphobacter sp. 4G125 TaxID=2763071 RepID=UPI001648BBED|nr:hypothetical protein [Edaphobacter sp. 4G125]QNI36876.1 hypothetical protein H7846_00585 [Edaphobacter sp. 4G125]
MGCREVVVLGVVVMGLVQRSIAAQQPMCHSTSAQDAVGIVVPEKLPPPVKMTGIGNSTMKITAANDEAREWFIQGLNLRHDFWDYEAAKAFEQAVRSDPNCVMCYWGLYETANFRGDSKSWGEAALKRAADLAKDKKRATKAERLYIEAALEDQKQHAARSKNGPNTGGNKAEPYKDSAETKVLRKLVKMEPEDVQARIYLAESMMDGFDRKGEPRQGTAEGQRILTDILKEHPDDTAANHYWIHAVEPGNHPELALESAKRLGALTPASGHMVHMPGHIFCRVGDYETARRSFENSMHVDEAYMRAQGVGVADDWNYVHNLMYLIADLMEAGRVTEAMEISAKLTKARGEVGPTLYRHSPRDGMTRLNVALPVLLRAGAWENATQVLEASKPDPEWKNLTELRDAMLNYTRGLSALERGDAKRARTESDALDVYVKTKPMTPPDDMPGMAGMSMSKDAMAMPVYSYLDVAAMELRASVLLAEGRGVESDALFSKAADAEKELGYREPPFYIRPVEETRGDALLWARRFDEAKKAYEVALTQRPNTGFALYGMAQADAGAGRRAETTQDYARLLKVWASADPNLPQMQAARRWMERQAVDGE